MSVVVVGLDHRAGPLWLLERLAIGRDRLSDVLDLLTKSDHVREAVVLSTCMRTEIYMDTVRFHGAVADAREALERAGSVARADFVDNLFELHDEAAFAHLFRVAAGLESAIVGESEVLRQVAGAWEYAREHGACRSILGNLFRHAVEVGKRARHETGISRGITSIGHAAVVLAERELGSLAHKKVAVLGAGVMGERMASTVRSDNDECQLFVCNRTLETAARLAARVNATAVAWNDLPALLGDVDALLTCTSSSSPLLGVEEIAPVMKVRNGARLVVIDMAVPRDVYHEVAAIPGVTLLDIDDLRRFSEAGMASRRREVDAVESIVQEEIAEYVADSNARLVSPVVQALHANAEGIRISELERLERRLQSLPPEQRALVEQLTKSLLAKWLHTPTVRLKEAAGTPEGERMAEALRALFDI